MTVQGCWAWRRFALLPYWWGYCISAAKMTESSCGKHARELLYHPRSAPVGRLQGHLVEIASQRVLASPNNPTRLLTGHFSSQVHSIFMNLGRDHGIPTCAPETHIGTNTSSPNIAPAGVAAASRQNISGAGEEISQGLLEHSPSNANPYNSPRPSVGKLFETRPKAVLLLPP